MYNDNNNHDNDNHNNNNNITSNHNDNTNDNTNTNSNNNNQIIINSNIMFLAQGAALLPERLQVARAARLPVCNYRELYNMCGYYAYVWIDNYTICVNYTIIPVWTLCNYRESYDDNNDNNRNHTTIGTIIQRIIQS